MSLAGAEGGGDEVFEDLGPEGGFVLRIVIRQEVPSGAIVLEAMVVDAEVAGGGAGVGDVEGKSDPAGFDELDDKILVAFEEGSDGGDAEEGGEFLESGAAEVEGELHGC